LGRLREEITIESPPSRVWRIVEKHLEHPEVPSGGQDSGEIHETLGEPLSTQRSGVGTRTRWHYKYRGKPFVWDDIVTKWDPGKQVTWKTTSGWEMEDEFLLMPSDADTQTRLVYDMNYRLPYGLLGRIYGKLLLEPRMRKHLKGVLAQMRSISENPFGALRESTLGDPT
jgi:polyketide cyclase/dehydrase/lipid transport protein